ncbi:MAG: hypothetical protein V9F02_10100 [Chitinophagaceae bacterium]
MQYRLLKTCTALNIKTVMLSGDKQSVVDEVAKAVGIDEAYGDLSRKERLRKYSN